jgi:hypothetical protein
MFIVASLGHRKQLDLDVGGGDDDDDTTTTTTAKRTTRWRRKKSIRYKDEV